MSQLELVKVWLAKEAPVQAIHWAHISMGSVKGEPLVGECFLDEGCFLVMTVL